MLKDDILEAEVVVKKDSGNSCCSSEESVGAETFTLGCTGTKNEQQLEAKGCCSRVESAANLNAVVKKCSVLEKQSRCCLRKSSVSESPKSCCSAENPKECLPESSKQSCCNSIQPETGPTTSTGCCNTKLKSPCCTSKHLDEIPAKGCCSSESIAEESLKASTKCKGSSKKSALANACCTEEYAEETTTKSASKSCESQLDCCSNKNVSKSTDKSCCSTKASEVTLEVSQNCCSSKNSGGCKSLEVQPTAKGCCSSEKPLGNPKKSQLDGCCSSKDTFVLKPDIAIDIADKTAQFRVQGMTCTGCENTLTAALLSHLGIAFVETSMFLERTTVTFDPTITNTDKILEVIVSRAGFTAFLEAAFDASRFKFVIITPGLVVSKIESILLKTKGVRKFQALKSGTEFDVELDLDVFGPRNVLETLGKEGIEVDLVVESVKTNDSNNMDQIRLLVSVTCCIPIVFLEWIFPESPADVIITGQLSIELLVYWVCATVVQFFVGYPIYVGAWNGLVYSRELNMDALVVLSTSVAYIYSTVALFLGTVLNFEPLDLFFETSIILLTLIILGRFMQSLARKRATKSFKGISKSYSDTVLLLEDNCSREIEKKWIQRNDLVLIGPGSYMPSDGIIVDGSGEVDESMVSGESIPVVKKVNDRVLGGTINISGSLTVKITHLISENMSSHIEKVIQEAQASKAKSQYLADKIAAWFTPIVILTAVVVYGTWYVLAVNNVVTVASPALNALGYAIAVLVISCPCAIALAVPTVIVVGAGVAAKYGILIKNAELFEQVCKCNTVIFDKTGTLTLGKPTVVEEWHDSNLENWAEILVEISSGAILSSHPTSQAIAAWSLGKSGYGKLEPRVTRFEEIPGLGVSFNVGTSAYKIGRRTFACPGKCTNARNLPENLMNNANSVSYVSRDSTLIAVFAFQDTLKPNARAAIERLRKNGFELGIITGDSSKSVEAIAKDLGISSYYSNCTPDDKLIHVRKLQKEGKRILFVGDGTNDGPVLAQADIGVSMGTATGVALESSEVILLSDDLSGVQSLIDISKQVLFRIKLNFAWAGIYNAIAIPLAAGAFSGLHASIRIPPALAGLGEIVSVMPVLIVALLLRNFRK